MFADVGIIFPAFSIAAREEAEHLTAVQTRFFFTGERKHLCEYKRKAVLTFT